MSVATDFDLDAWSEAKLQQVEQALDAPRPPDGDWLGTPYLTFERRGSLAVCRVDRPQKRKARRQREQQGVEVPHAHHRQSGALAGGSHSFTARQTDVAGNTSAASTPARPSPKTSRTAPVNRRCNRRRDFSVIEPLLING
mgnify:CR=1 FL=1